MICTQCGEDRILVAYSTASGPICAECSTENEKDLEVIFIEND